jgi:hypothetical protein
VFRCPRIFSFVRNVNLLASQFYAHSEFLDLFHLPLTIFAFEELPELKDLLSSNHSSDQMDVWVYNWEDNYILANFYAKNHKHLTIHTLAL